MLVGVFALATLILASRSPRPDAEQSPDWPYRWWIVALAAAFALIVAVIGTDVVFHRFLLADDEYSAWFQAVIFAHGKTSAHVAAPWCTWINALTPSSIVAAPDCSWRLSYLPIHSLIKAAFIWLGADRFSGPVLAAVEVLLVASLARKLWPDKPYRAYVAALSLALSTQVLFMSMTMYSMPTHLLFALVWLWLYVDDRRVSLMVLPWVGALALGVHSPFPHLLLVPPFILRYVWQKRWAMVGYVAAVYALALMFWKGYIDRVPAGFAPTVASPAATMAVAGAVVHRSDAIGAITAAMQVSLIATWSVPIVVILVVAAMIRWRELDTFSRDAALSIMLVVVARVFVGSPLQGEGWGYRFVYSNLGCFVLLAAAGFDVLARAAGLRRATVLLASAAGLALLVQIPMRARQVEGIVRPYYRASTWMAGLPAPIVVYPSEMILWGRQLVRNDPFLEHGNKIMSRSDLTRAQGQQLLTAFPGKVLEVSRRELYTFGLRPAGILVGDTFVIPPASFTPR